MKEAIKWLVRWLAQRRFNWIDIMGLGLFATFVDRDEFLTAAIILLVGSTVSALVEAKAREWRDG